MVEEDKTQTDKKLLDFITVLREKEYSRIGKNPVYIRGAYGRLIPAIPGTKHRREKGQLVKQ